MIRKLEVSGLRGFEQFTLGELGRVNLLVGENNCGKSTLLEGIQLLSAPGDLRPLIQIMSRRAEVLLDIKEPGRIGRSMDVCRLFYGHELSAGRSISLVGKTDWGEQDFDARIVELPSPEDDKRDLYTTPDPNLEEPEAAFSRLGLKVSWKKFPDATTTIPITRAGGLSLSNIRRLSISGGDSENTQIITTAALTSSEVIALFESVMLTPDEDFVVDALKIIEPSIDRIATTSSEGPRGYSMESGRGGVLVRCKGIQNRIPIGSMGDGIWRMLGLALAIVKAEGGVLLVDEIDTGLHYTTMDRMWQMIRNTARRRNVQVFATTHSRDCIESLAEVCREKHGEADNEVTIQRIERGRDCSVMYSEDEIIAAAGRGMEFR